MLFGLSGGLCGLIWAIWGLSLLALWSPLGAYLGSRRTSGQSSTRRSVQKGPERGPQSVNTSSQSVRGDPRFREIVAIHGQNSANLDQHSLKPKFVDIGLTSVNTALAGVIERGGRDAAQIRTTSAVVGQTLAKLNQDGLPMFEYVEPRWVTLLPNSTIVGRSLPQAGQTWSDFGHIGPMFVELGQSLGQHLTKIDQRCPCVGQRGPVWVGLGLKLGLLCSF